LKENDFLQQLRVLATHPAARGLTDDAAILTIGRQKIVLTHDMLVEGVHFLPASNPADVAWKLLAVNLSDLAAKGAKPMGVLLGYGGGGDPAWDSAFVAGLRTALDHFAVPLLGGDSVALPIGSARCLGMTAIGEGRGHIVPGRDGAVVGDALFVSGPIGDGWAGLQLEQSPIDPADKAPFASLLQAYNRPMPQLDTGRAIAHMVHAMMDISDGLLLDAQRIAITSKVGIAIDLDAVPLSSDYVRLFNDDRQARLQAVCGGDDYQLLAAAPRATVWPFPMVRIGTVVAPQPQGLSLHDRDGPVPLPDRLGYLHGA
jgi:thiamine-monophosphate kinase